jgi:limonene-1,2-epoxide hydrolase
MTTADASVAHRFARAFNSGEVDQVLEVFTEDVIYHDLFYGRVEGREKLGEMFSRVYAQGTYHRWTMTNAAVGSRCTMCEWDFELTLSDAAARGAGRTLRYPGASVFDTPDGRCHAYREYFDRTAALLAAGVAPSSVAAIVARRPTIDVTLPEDRPR